MCRALPWGPGWNGNDADRSRASPVARIEKGLPLGDEVPSAREAAILDGAEQRANPRQFRRRRDPQEHAQIGSVLWPLPVIAREDLEGDKRGQDGNREGQPRRELKLRAETAKPPTSAQG